jgi:hypothetical protein
MTESKQELTKQEFYDFALMMKKDSNILFENEAFHNSVYLAGYVLEGYIKMLLVHNGADTYRGNGKKSYGGHLNDSKLLERLKTFYPETFNTSICQENTDKYPENLLDKNKYDIKSRYKINHWIDIKFCQIVQNEILKIEQELIRLKRDGVLNDNN